MEQSHLEELMINDDEVAIRELLAKDSSLLLQPTSQGVSPLMLSCYFHKPLITNAIIDFLENLTLFEAAAAGKFDEVAHLIFKFPTNINDYSEDGFTALGLACFFGKEEVARYLVLKGADVNLSSNNGYHVYPIHSAIAGNFTNIAKMLLDQDADVNVCQTSGVSPLHSAAQHGNIEIIVALLEKGAHVNVRMEGGKLPADLAKEKGFLEIAEILSI
jgi:ankyrin repeat protein